MSKELGEEELYALARVVVGERCAALEAAFRTGPGQRLVYSGDALGPALLRDAGTELPTLAGREHAGMLALASLEWLFKVCGRPWLDPDSTIPAETLVERCIRHVRGLLRYLNPADAEAAYRFAERLDAMLRQSEFDAQARHVTQEAARNADVMRQALRSIGDLYGREEDPGQRPDASPEAKPADSDKADTHPEGDRETSAVPAPVANPDSKPAGTVKVWTTEKLAELSAYREAHGIKKAAEHYQISEQRIRQLLPKGKPYPKGYSAFTHRMK